MTAKEFISKYLQDCEYGSEISREAEEAARANNLVVVFGASDDLCEFRGAIDDEYGCCNGGVIKAENCPAEIEAVWCEGEYSWTYKTDIPHEEFDVLEDGEKYCRGIVFSLDDVYGQGVR